MDETPRRARMMATSAAAQRWAEGLREEVEQWPGVAVKRAFGMTLIYREKVVFAALPGSRALYEEDAILIKFGRETAALAKRISAESRFAAGTMQDRGKKKQGEGRKWRIFLLREERDARDAVEWLARAYDLAAV
jgi:hypothetical protein